MENWGLEHFWLKKRSKIMWLIKNRIGLKKFWVTHNFKKMCVFPEASSPGSHSEESSTTQCGVSDGGLTPWVQILSSGTSSLIWVLPVVCRFFTGLRQQTERWRWILCCNVKPPGPESAFLHLFLMAWAIQKVPFLTEASSWRVFLATPRTEVRFLEMKERQER